MNSNEDFTMIEEDRRSLASVDSRRSRASKTSKASFMEAPPSPGVPRLPEPSFDLSLSLEQIIADAKFDETIVDREKKEQVDKRASNVMRLAAENEKLNAELKAMSDRLRAAEARTQALLNSRAERLKQDAYGPGGQAANGQKTATAASTPAE